MIRNLKALGLLALMALAGSALFASAANAEGAKGTLTAGITPEEHKKAEIIGEQYDKLPESAADWNYFGVTPNPAVKDMVTCDKALLTDTTNTGTETKLTSVAADYIHCQAGTQPATVTMNGCEYTLTQPTTVAPLGTGKFTGKVDLTCPGSNRIVVHVYLFGNATSTSHSFNVCTIEVYPTGGESEGHRTQELGGHAIYQNDDPAGLRNDDITATVDVNGITVNDGCHSEHHTNGVYKQTVTIKAFEDNETTAQYDLWLSD